MRRRKRNSLARIGILCVVLVLAVGVMGISYGAWTDEIDVAGTVETGNVDTELINLVFDPNSGATYISGSANDMTLYLHIEDAQVRGYDCDFDIENDGSLPVIIQSITYDPELVNWPSGFTVGITGVAEGDQIDPGDTPSGTVHVEVTADPGTNFDFNFTVTFDIVAWNQYVP